MPALLALVPAVVWRWLAIAGVGAALAVFGFVKGVTHQENADAVTAAKLETARALADAKQAATLRPIASQYVETHADETKLAPAVATGIARVLRCPTSPASTSVPAIRSGVASAPRAGSVDASGSPAIDEGLAGRIGNDAALYGACVTQLNALIQTAIAAGANKP